MKKAGKIATLLMVVLMMLSLVACGNESSGTPAQWPTSELASMLPVPEGQLENLFEFDDSFSICVENVNEDAFKSYVANCKEKGFTIDAEESSDQYTAFNSEGYKLDLTYWTSLNRYDIDLSTPKATGDLTWPTFGLATLLPVPNSSKGDIYMEGSDEFGAYVGDTSIEDYKKYVDACIEAGFNIDYSKSEKHFSAENENGDSLYVDYEGFNIMDITVYSSDYLSDLTETETTVAQKTTEIPATKAETETEEQKTEAKEEFATKSDSWKKAGKGVGALLPEPIKEYDLLQYSDFIVADVSNASYEDFNDYVEACIEAGFEGKIDSAESPDYYYKGKKSDGARVEVFLYESDGKISISAFPAE